ncbi:MAG: hypothetical protein H6Q02_1980 [Acidobacteria bacterium]|nr:hypothetical protein [Acidobacteriota bacterium]
MPHRRAAALLLLGVALLPGCGGDPADDESDLAVVNDSACDLVVYVDGREALPVPAGSDATLDDIGSGRHVVEALDRRGGLVERRSIELAVGEDFYWTIDDC